jgi:hypothetical protein
MAERIIKMLKRLIYSNDSQSNGALEPASAANVFIRAA